MKFIQRHNAVRRLQSRDDLVFGWLCKLATNPIQQSIVPTAEVVRSAV